MYKLKKEELKMSKFKNCYAMANGLGGFVSTNVFDATFRKHQGYLVASFLPPIERFLLLKTINESIVINSKKYDFDSFEYESKQKKGFQFLNSFEFENYPIFTYSVDGLKLVKKIAPIYGKNAVCITYHVESEVQADISLKPFFNYRVHGEVNEANDFDYKFTENNDGVLFELPNGKKLYFQYEGLVLKKNKKQITESIKSKYDYENGDDRLDVSYTPFDLSLTLKENEIKNFSIICSLDETLENVDYIKLYDDRMNMLKEQANINNEFALRLVKSADQFISYRKSTNNYTILAGLPWFTDWGRDTMIAFTGLTLVTKRFDEALSILKSFQEYEKNGLIPNMFPDHGEEPLYNTVDASLLYVNACYKYIEYTNDYESIKPLYRTLKNIIHYYENGTDFSIYMSEDGLIHAGSDMDQVTWMDVRAHGIVVTPRHGYPVEINALWYNALMIMNHLGRKYKDVDAKHYKELALKVKESYKHFITPDGSLLDVYNPDDNSVRPNQLYAYALPYKVLSKSDAKKSFKVVEAELYNVYGMRSLSIKDPRFKPYYTGSLFERDMAYHMGTTWGHLLGIYVDGLFYVKSKDVAKKKATKLFEKFSTHLNEGCIDGVAEVFDGKKAVESKGCFTQAWGVAEVLRAYYENILK